MKNSKNRRFNPGEALKMLILTGFSAFYVLIVADDQVGLYVHPRIVPYILFAAAVMLTVALLSAKDLFNPNAAPTRLLPLLFFAVPLVMAFAVPAVSLDTDAGTVGDIQLGSAGADTSDDILSDDGAIHMDDDHYYACLCALYNNPEDYVGAQIEVVGFVLKDYDGFEDDEFIPARLLMVCCAADMSPVGLLCRYAGTASLETGAWVRVTGTIELTDYNGETVPRIAAENVETAQAPDAPYVYPVSFNPLSK